MRVVVAGGTGFIGREVVSRLLEERGVEVAVTTRYPEHPDPWDGRVRKIQAFAGDVVSLGCGVSSMSRERGRARVCPSRG